MSNNNLAHIQKDITDVVNTKVTSMQQEGLSLPSNYSAANALKSAFFKLQTVKDRNKKGALEVCTQTSIANALLDMVTQGLSPAKTQCYFIVYGNELQLQRSYFGTQAVLKRLNNVQDIWANVIYEGDVFDYAVTDGRERLVKHDTSFLNRDNPILGAYAVIKQEDGDEILTIMTMKEIKAAWSKTKTGGGVQEEFPQEMAKRTVINRAAKAYINTSDDSDLLVDAINRSTENEYDNENNVIKDVTEEISQNANVEELDFAEPEIIEAPVKEEPKRQAKKLTIEDVEDIPLFNSGVKSTLDDGAPF